MSELARAVAFFEQCDDPVLLRRAAGGGGAADEAPSSRRRWRRAGRMPSPHRRRSRPPPRRHGNGTLAGWWNAPRTSRSCRRSPRAIGRRTETLEIAASGRVSGGRSDHGAPARGLPAAGGLGGGDGRGDGDDASGRARQREALGGAAQPRTTGGLAMTAPLAGIRVGRPDHGVGGAVRDTSAGRLRGGGDQGRRAGTVGTCCGGWAASPGRLTAGTTARPISTTTTGTNTPRRSTCARRRGATCSCNCWRRATCWSRTTART